MLKTSGNHKNGGLYNNFFEKFEFRKKKMRSQKGRKFWKIDFSQISYNKFNFFMSNLNVECFQLSFDIHIVHVGQK